MSSVASPLSDRALLPGTFVHLAGIGLKTEHRLWHSGIASWAALRSTRFARRLGLIDSIDRSEQALVEGDLEYFFGALPAAQRWRTYADFRERFAAVDIETTGMSIYDEVTVIGVEFQGEYRTFVRGANLHEAADALSAAHGIITFNGALFDLPFLARCLPGVDLPRAHVDLRFLSRRVGLAGPLKKVERLAKLHRGQPIVDVDGFEATVLWSEFEHGDLRSLRRLVQYNAADTCVLRPLADLVVSRLRSELERARARPSQDNAQLSLDIDGLVPAARNVAKRRPRPPRVRTGPGHLLTVGPQTIALPPRAEVQPAVVIGDLHARMAKPDSRIVGIDLTGSDARPSGWALLQGDLVVTGTIRAFDELVARTVAVRPRLVSIDSPLSLPVGRDCTNDDCNCRLIGGITRQCERDLKGRGVNVYPCLIQSMQALTRRGIRLAAALRERGIEVIESYPGAAQDIMRIPRKRTSQGQLRAGLVRFGVRGMRPAGQLTHDELDAVTSATVGSFYLADLYEALGNEEERYLIIPSLTALPGSVCHHMSTITAPSCLMVVGAAADRAQRPLRDYEVVFGDWESFWTMLREHGSAVRAAVIAASGERRLRRPTFADVWLREDDAQLKRVLRRWAKEWCHECQ